MQKILSYLRKNTLQVIFAILFIIFVYSLIHSGDKTYKEQEKQVSVSESKETAKVTNSECEKTIKEFLEKCTAGNYENAYVYLSDKCKQENYPTLDDFINNYCISNSIKGKDFSIKKQADNPKLTYMIKLNNMLSSGKINNNIQTFYYTIDIQDNKDIKISIER